MSPGVRNEARLGIKVVGIWREKMTGRAGMRGGLFAMTKEPSKVKVKDSAYCLGRGGGWSKVLMIWQGGEQKSCSSGG